MRTVRAARATGLLVTGLTLVPSVPAGADPAALENASDAVVQLTELGHEAEIVTEQLHDAQIALDARLTEEAAAQTRLAAARKALTAASTERTSSAAPSISSPRPATKEPG